MVVLEAWCYTRTAETEVVHVVATGFQGIPGGVALGTNSPDDGDDSIYTNNSKGLHHLYQGSVGDGKHWITVIQGSHGVIDLNFVYTLSLLVTVYTLSLLALTVYTVT